MPKAWWRQKTTWGGFATIVLAAVGIIKGTVTLEVGLAAAFAAVPLILNQGASRANGK